MLKCNAVTSVLRASPLNWALVCKRKNVAISQDLAVDLFFGVVSFGAIESNFFAEILLVEFVGTKADLLAERTFSLVW